MVKLKNVRIYYRVANVYDSSDEFTNHMDLEILPNMFGKILEGFYKHDITYFYSIAEVKSLCDILENVERLRGYTFLTYSISAISDLD